MPVRSVNLKLIVPRNRESLALRKSIWDTHDAVNSAVRYYEEKLLLMRGAAYTTTGDQIVTEKSIESQLMVMLREAQVQNGLPEPIGSDSQLVSLARHLYECIVPSSVGKDGNAQQANAYISPLVDPMSTGFLSIFEKLSTIPPWATDVKEEEAIDMSQAKAWLRTSAGQQRLKETGAPPRWRKLLNATDPLWPEAFIEDVRRKQEEVEGAPRIVCSMMEAAVLPLFPAYFATRLKDYNESVSRWDRLAFRLAVGHLLSWESWCRIAADEHKARRDRVDEFERTNLTPDIDASLAALRRYEKERHTEELTRDGSLPMDRPFRITLRQTRGWQELRERWRASKDKSESRLKEIAAQLQTKLRGRYGDPHLFLWLAKESHRIAWDTAKDVLSIHARHNAMRGILERSRDTAIMTLPDAIEHPRFIQWEAEGGSNFRNYRLERGDNGRLKVTLPLLKQIENGQYTESDLEYHLAPSGQLRSPRIEKVNGKIRIKYHSVLDEEYTAELGAADLLVDREFLSNRHPELIDRGEIGPAFLKLSLDIEHLLPNGWTPKRHQGVTHFLTARGANQHQKKVTPGLRVLSVDLGVRSFGACSVFELVEDNPKSKLSFHVEGLNLWAVHERSFLITLPDEDVGTSGLVWQEEQQGQLRRLRAALNRYRVLYSLAKIEVDDRKTALSDIGINEYAFENEIYRDLREGVNLPMPLWSGEVTKALKEFRKGMGLEVARWRKSSTSRETRKHMGKSFWSIQYLQDTRRFLYAWSHLGRFSGDIRRADKDKRGVHAGNLLRHIDNVKADRLKTGSDLIVQAARGYIRDKHGRWSKVYNPCHIVLFEDLSRYLMRTDRPRRENSQLMKWAHRAVPKEVQMQGELYGIHVCDTSAAFSSRYHAKTHAPGIRCRSLTKKDLEDPFMIEILQRENPSLTIDTCKDGDLVPLSGGEIFISMNAEGTISQAHADINAAQNLQRRFWTRHGDAFRLPCRRAHLDGEVIWIPRTLGKRVKGALGSFGYLMPTDHESGSCRWKTLTPARWKALIGAEVSQEELSEELVELEALAEEALELDDEYQTFFRDPSGLDLWFPAAQFWGMTKAKISSALKK